MPVKLDIEVEDEDTGYAAVVGKLKNVQGKELIVGVLEPDKKHPSGSTVGKVALAHEFGQGRNRQRSFLRATFDSNASNYAAILFEEFKDWDIDQALDKLGRIMVQNVKFKIMSYPLYDTGTLVRSIGAERKG